MKYPVKLKRSPINEISLELRFKSHYPPEAVFGVFYSHIQEQFSAKPKPHTIMQLPEKIRLNDPALRYTPYYKLENHDMVLNIGPEVVSFVNRQLYLGWEAFSKIFYKTFKNLIDSQVFKDIHSMNLRYINVFKENIFNHINLKIIFESEDIHDQPIDFKTVLYKENFENFIRIGNSFDIEIEDQIVKRSIVDISCKSKIENSETFLRNPSDLIEKAHKIEKEIFFQTLKKDYIKTFDPTETLNSLIHNSSVNDNADESEIKIASCYEKKYIFNPEPITKSEPLVKTPIQKKVKLKLQKPRTLEFSSIEDENGFINE